MGKRPRPVPRSSLTSLIVEAIFVDFESRLLRNRVSAQQARERKKAYLNDLEVKVKDLEKKNLELEERLSTLQNENQMLRQVRLIHFCFIIIIFI